MVLNKTYFLFSERNNALVLGFVHVFLLFI
uniref:Uncharacterized protein n=1 Tax=Podoviridae sp. ct53O25 TaxID=2826539 RepID=A0A8S5MCK0_9CAUD|nr:MAG TPA: hypothetical protein [Podoviridae sp. ct53O25]